MQKSFEMKAPLMMPNKSHFSFSLDIFFYDLQHSKQKYWPDTHQKSFSKLVSMRYVRGSGGRLLSDFRSFRSFIIQHSHIVGNPTILAHGPPFAHRR